MSDYYTQDQKIFTLSILSNLLGDHKGPGLDKILLDLVTNHLSDLEHKLEAWRMVWGPCVYQYAGVDKGPPDSAMYAAQNQDGSELVVAIAGTNSNSTYDWVVLNSDVFEMVGWNGQDDDEKKTARGTSTGLGHLQAMRPRATVEAPDKPLIDFLQQWVHAADKPVTVTITGHSLGGALSTVTGLWLKNQKSVWDPHNRATLKVWSSGGPTPGNAAFARYYDEQLGANTTRFSNSLDPVPLAWTVSDLHKIYTLYSDVGGPRTPILIRGFVATAIYRLEQRSTNYTHILVDTSAHQGTLKSGLDFIPQVLYQHAEAYCTLVGTPELIPLFQGEPLFQREPIITPPPLMEDEEMAKAILAQLEADEEAIAGRAP
jgi:hypothetical protein